MRVNRKELVECIALLKKVVHKKTTMPILSHIRLKYDGGSHAALTGTDLRTSVICEIKSDYGDNPIDILIDLSILENQLKPIKSTYAEITVEDSVAVCKLDGMTTRLRTMPASDYPKIETIQDPDGTFYQTSDIYDDFRYVARSIYKDPSRPHLYGISLDSNVLCALDGHRLHMATLQEPISNGAKLLHGYAIPAISHFLKKSINNAWLYNKTHLQIQNENVAIITKLSDCSFPPYEKIIPQTQSVKAFVNSSILLKKTKIIASMEPKKPYGMDLSLNGKLTLSYNDSHTGETKIDIESVKYPSNFMDIEARYNPRYIADALTGGKDEEATLAWEWENDKDGPLNPIKIDQGNKTAIIMPIRK